MTHSLIRNIGSDVSEKTACIRGGLETASNVAAYLAHPFLDIPYENYSFNRHEIDSIYTYLRRNRVILRALNNALVKKPIPLIKERFVNEIIQKYELFAQTYDFAYRLRQKILDIAKAITERGVDIIFFKAHDDFPLDSHNFDIIVKEQDCAKTKEILENLGFKELVWLREPFKWFYRRVDNDLIISIHLHTKVAWVGVEFVDSQDLCNRYREMNINGVKIGFPSPEHHMLVTVAHAFFENQGLKLCDLLDMIEAVSSYDGIDWNYIVDWCINDHWFNAFYTFLRLSNHVCKSLYGEKLVEEEVFQMMEKKDEIERDYSTKKLVNHFERKQTLPMKIDRSIVAFQFISKVFRTPNMSFIRKMGKVSSTGWQYIAYRMPFRRELPTFLICFSGLDGSGKTTHAKSLQYELMRIIHVINDDIMEKNFDASYVWSRGIGLTIDPLLRIIRWPLLSEKSSHTDDYAPKHEKLLKKEPIKTLWAYTMLADELLQLLINVKIPLLLRQKQIVICDRYISDTLIDVECDLDKNVSWLLEKFAFDLSPKPKITFITDTDPAEILRRKEGLKFQVLRCKREKYLAYSCDERLILIDTEKDLQQNKKEILSKILELLLMCA